MDFDLTQGQRDVAELARRIFTDHPVDAWPFLERAGLLETTGLLEACALLAEQGRAAAPAPLWAVLVGAMAAPGRGLVVSAIIDETPALTLAGGAVTGVLDAVPAPVRADRLLVLAAGPVLALVDPRGPGVTAEAQIVTTGETAQRVTLAGAPAELLYVPARWLLGRATVALCALELGLAERALSMTAAHVSQRRQFDRPIATFQAVAQRAADAYIDVEVIRLTMWQAAFLLAEGRDDEAAGAVALAKLWAAEAGHRVVSAAQHLHGGIGFDADHPLGRCFLWSKQIELTLGSAARQLARLGHILRSR
jgi:3-oxocholest-4-en-26-oyl-CoA dehydrogenase beta subunit